MNELEELKPQEINYTISTEEDLTRLNAVLKKCMEINKKIDEKLDPRIAEANKTHKGLTALKKETKKPWDEVINKIKTSLKEWYGKKEEEAKALQDRINADLAEKAEEYKKDLIEEAQNSDEWSKEVLLDKANSVVPISVDIKDCKESVNPKITGQYKKSCWKAKIIDESLIPREFLCPDLNKIDDFAKKFKEDGFIKGCQIWDDFTIVTRA